MSAADCPDCKAFLEETNRLRAEVERLKEGQKIILATAAPATDTIMRLEREREEALSEVERLQKYQTFGYWRTRANRLEQQIEVLEHERDEALEREKEQSKALAILGDELTASQRETDEALAQVAVVLEAECEDHPGNLYGKDCGGCREANRRREHVPTEAHALLDRLQRAEAAMTRFSHEAKEVMSEKGSYDVQVDALVLAEYERAYILIQALAAWEASK